MPTFISGLPERKERCKVTFTNWDKTVECAPHTRLKDLAGEHDIDLHNGLSRFFNCIGLGTCGTCAVEVVPQSGVSSKGARENLRFFHLRGNLRLACQVRVTEDIQVTKHAGLMGTRGYKQELPREEVVRLYREEENTLAEIADAYQCPVSKVVRILEQAGVEMRRTGSAA